MKSLRRYNFIERDYFITLVTFQRAPLLLVDRELFWNCWGEICPFAWVILPDHAHFMLNSGEMTLSTIIHHFKITYSRRFRDAYRKGRVWQNRFWDHAMRDQADFNNHLNYIHFNPVKHRLAKAAAEWEYSSFDAYVANGHYREDWGQVEIPSFDGDYGE